MLNANILDILKSTVVDISKDAAMLQAQNTAVFLKTNLGPEIEIDPFSPSPSIFETLGVKFAVTLVDKTSGEIIYQSDTPPETDTLKVVMILGGTLAVAALLVRGLTRR